jgi:hypothetical protein
MLRKWPTSSPDPAPFVPGSHAQFQASLNCAKQAFHLYPDEVEEWEKWYESQLPHSDDAMEYKKDHSANWHIPFEEILFRGAPRRAEGVAGEGARGRSYSIHKYGGSC